jgi:hypothetical protein
MMGTGCVDSSLLGVVMMGCAMVSEKGDRD